VALGDRGNGAVFESEKELGEAACFVAVMGDVENGYRFRALDGLEEGEEFVPGVIVESGERFV
jgi:hypothetical protein